MLERLLNLFGKKRRHPPKAGAEDEAQKRREMLRSVSEELRHLKNSIKNSDAKGKSRQFLALVKAAYAQALSLKYEATFQELQREINKCKRIHPTLREEMDKFLEELSYMDYDWEECLEVLQKQGSPGGGSGAEKHVLKAHHAPRKRLRDITRERALASERELLLHTIERFEGYLQHLF